MFAKSEKIENVGVGNVPLFAKHVPLPATHRGVAASAIKQYQVVQFDLSTNRVTPVTQAGGGGVMPAPWIGVAAYPAESGEEVTFYTHGTINVDAIDVSSISALGWADAKTKMLTLNTLGSQTLVFDVVPATPTLPV